MLRTLLAELDITLAIAGVANQRELEPTPSSAPESLSTGITLP